MRALYLSIGRIDWTLEERPTLFLPGSAFQPLPADKMT
jgi:hypothetical protein